MHPAELQLRQCLTNGLNSLNDWNGHDTTIFPAIIWPKLSHARIALQWLVYENRARPLPPPDWATPAMINKLRALCHWALVNAVLAAEASALAGDVDQHYFVKQCLVRGDVERAELIQLSSYLIDTPYWHRPAASPAPASGIGAA